MASDEDRLTRVEENSYFMEERLKNLEQLTNEQQPQLEAMRKKIEGIQKNLAEVRDFLGEMRTINQEEQIPPHHVARFW